MSNSNPKPLQREARIRWVPLSKMKVNPLAQREINPARVDRMVANFDLENMGRPTVNFRDGWYYVIDGQHRVEALRALGFGDESIEVECYTDLSEEAEAEHFLKKNDTLTVDALAKFRVGVQAGRDEETDINRVVLSQGLVVSRDKSPGAIGAVGTLRRVYRRAGSKTLARTLRITRDAYGDAGMEAAVIDGLGLLCQRYNGQLNDEEAIERLSKAHGGVKGLLNSAEKLRNKTGNQKGHCVAAAAVDIINAGKGGKKLPSWWK